MSDGRTPDRAESADPTATAHDDWRPLLDLTPAGVLVHQSGVIVYANPSAVRMLGASSAADLVGRPALSLVHPDLLPIVMARIGETIRRHGTAPVLEERLLRIDGTSFDAQVTAVPFTYNGAPAVFVSAIDVTERNRSQAELRRSEEKFRTLFEHAGDAVIIHDIEGRILEVNQAACDRLGYTRDELLSKLPIDLEAVEPIVLSGGGTAGLRTLETAYLRRDGSIMPAELTSRSIQYEGQPAILSIARDISERKRVEAELRRLAEAVHQAGEAIVVTDTSGRIEYVNPAFERVSGYAAGAALGKNPRVLKSGHHPDEFYAQLWRTIASGRTWTGRMVNRRADGSLYTEDCTIAPVKDHRGRIERYVAVKRDVTREVALEEQFRQAQRLESVGQLAAGIAHDLNNLLQPILGYAELTLADSAPTESHYQATRQIMEAGRRSRELVRQLLTFGRQQPLDVQALDVREIVDGMTTLLRRTIREDISIRTTASREPCLARVDRGQVEQVLMNLAVNAQDAMASGGTLAIDVSLGSLAEHRCTTQAPLLDAPYVVLTVSDSGVGMDGPTRARMFEPFFTTKGAAGTGLGLATVYGIVRQHDGHITVDSEVGRGTTLRVYLPQVEPDRDRGADTDAPAAGGVETILVVEDDDHVRRLACRVLERHGYHVIPAANAEDALAAADAHPGPIHLLLTDVVMPGGSGLGLYDRIRVSRPGIGVLYMSGYPRGAAGHPGAADAGMPLLQKPFTVNEIAAAVRSAIAGRRR